jgi:hypothetical protein
MSRPEVAKRLAIKAAIEAGTGITQARLVELFRTSFRTVNVANRHSIQDWVMRLEVAPAPREHPPAPRATRKIARSKRPGDRSRARHEPPEPTVEHEEIKDFDEPEPAIDDEALERAASEEADRLDRVARGIEEGNRSDDESHR